ncbi:MAG: DUF523 domain-containing protein [Clostridiales bacterium]|nr:DUF523 domain-containing protein [Clostridiales bacterium]
MYIISRCLLGHNCKYDGGNNRNEELIEFCRTHDYITVCPETAACLPSPRQPAEIVPVEDGYFKVYDKDGKDLTRDFDYGAELSLQSVLVEHGSRKYGTCKIEGAILKANSPSCGAGSVYDGSFSGKLVGGNGLFTDKLIDACIAERENPDISEERRAFADDFRICDENNFARVFGDK